MGGCAAQNAAGQSLLVITVPATTTRPLVTTRPLATARTIILYSRSAYLTRHKRFKTQVRGRGQVYAPRRLAPNLREPQRQTAHSSFYARLHLCVVSHSCPGARHRASPISSRLLPYTAHRCVSLLLRATLCPVFRAPSSQSCISQQATAASAILATKAAIICKQTLNMIPKHMYKNRASCR